MASGPDVLLRSWIVWTGAALVEHRPRPAAAEPSERARPARLVEAVRKNWKAILSLPALYLRLCRDIWFDVDCYIESGLLH